MSLRRPGSGCFARPRDRPGYAPPVDAYRNYPEESRYSEPEPGYADQGWYGEQRRPSDLPSPEPRGYADQPHSDPGWDSGRTPGSVMPPRPGPPPDEPARRPPAGPPPGSPGPASDAVYRSRRPAAAVLFGLPAAILEIPALFLLADSAGGDGVAASGVVAASCLLLALPLAAYGLYAVATGAVRAAGPNSGQAWLRPPVAYLTVALVLFIAAGLAG
jgi:hypothetical protein